MTVQNETAWLLDVIKTNYPGTWPSDLVRRNGDDSTTLDVTGAPVHEEGVELTVYNVVGVSRGDVTRSLFGTKPQYDVETQLDVTVEGLHEYENGQVADSDEFLGLVRYVQYAINTQLVYPAVDTGDEDIGRVSYKDLGIVNDNNLSPEYRDKFEYRFTVRLRGYADTP